MGGSDFELTQHDMSNFTMADDRSYQKPQMVYDSELEETGDSQMD